MPKEALAPKPKLVMKTAARKPEQRSFFSMVFSNLVLAARGFVEIAAIIVADLGPSKRV